MSLLPWAPGLPAVTWECAKAACLSLVGHCCAAQGRARSVLVRSCSHHSKLPFFFHEAVVLLSLVWNVVLWSTDVLSGWDWPALLLSSQPGQGSTGLLAMAEYLFCASCPPVQWAGLSW